MGASGILRLFLRIEAGAVVRHDDLVTAGRLPRGYRDLTPPFTVAPDAVAHGVFHDRLQGQGRQRKGLAPDIVLHGQLVLKTHLLQGQVLAGMLQLLAEGDRRLRLQAVHVPSQVFRKLDRRCFGLGGIRMAQFLDHRERVVEEVRLDLAEHDLELLVHHQGVLMVPDEFQVQVDINEQGAAHDGDRQVAQGDVLFPGVLVQLHREKDEQDAQDGNQTFFPAHTPRFPDDQVQQVGQYDPADDVGRIPQRPAVILVVVCDVKRHRRKQRGQEHGGVDRDQDQENQVLPVGSEDMAEQQQDQRPYRVVIYAQDRSRGHPFGLVLQPGGKNIRYDQGHDQRDDGHNDPLLFFEDIRIDAYRQEQQHHLQQHRHHHAVAEQRGVEIDHCFLKGSNIVRQHTVLLVVPSGRTRNRPRRRDPEKPEGLLHMNIHLRIGNGDPRPVQGALAIVHHAEVHRPVIRRADPDAH